MKSASFFRIGLLGDVVVANALGKADPLGDLLKQHLSEHDLTIFNLEAPILDEDTLPSAQKIGPVLKQHSDIGKLLNSKYLDIALLANNHIADFGVKGIEQTQSRLDAHGIRHIGTAYKPLIAEKNACRIAIFAAAEGQFGAMRGEETNGYVWLLHPKLKEEIQKAKHNKEIQKIWLFVHAGLEGEAIPLPEWRQIYREFIDLGVDLIVGTHPHHIQGKEIYQGKPIYYSLGNAFFNLAHAPQSWYQSIFLSVCIDLTTGDMNTEEHLLCLSGQTLDIANNQEELKCFLEKQKHILENKELYNQHIKEICLAHWERYYESYLFFPKTNVEVLPLDKGIKRLLKRQLHHLLEKIKARFFHQNDQQEMFWLHVFQTETHRFVIERALRERSKT
ncbi:MAG: CapA family protein [Bernardetiaceae bacterium]